MQVPDEAVGGRPWDVDIVVGVSASAGNAYILGTAERWWRSALDATELSAFRFRAAQQRVRIDSRDTRHLASVAERLGLEVIPSGEC